jgi:bacteriocin-like protein
MTNDIRELNINELDAVTGGCTHGTGDCKTGSGKGDGLGQLRAIEGGLVEAGKAVVAGIVGMF